MTLFLIMLCAHLAFAAPAPTAAPNVTQLKDRYIETLVDVEKQSALDLLARTAPVTAQDVSALFDLFSRFPDAAVRTAIMSSLALITPDNSQLEPLFLNYLKQDDPEAQLFGVNGAFRLRSRSALPLIRSIAERKITKPRRENTEMFSERSARWTQYEALSALAQWETDKSYALIERKARDNPAVGRLLGRYYWPKTISRLKEWSSSSDMNVRERAELAASAPIEPSEARATRGEMLKLLKDSAVDTRIRHQLALKIGLSSSDDQIEELVREHDAVSADTERLYWATAIFASRSPKAVPLLVRYAQDSPDETLRRGSRAQLIDMLGQEQADTLIKR